MEVFCRECGKQIEEDARFCRFCGKSQADPGSEAAGAGTSRPGASTKTGLEGWLRRLFPRHHLQDEFMHIATIAAFGVAVIGFILGFFASFYFLATSWLLFSIAIFLFLILRESTLSHIRVRGPARPAAATRYHADRTAGSAAPPAAEAASAESSPPGTETSPKSGMGEIKRG